MYCPSDNTIYSDHVFVARQAKAAAAQLGTDGDMAAAGIIAHEMGHAVQIQLGEDSNIHYENEATADCLAGARGRLRLVWNMRYSPSHLVAGLRTTGNTGGWLSPPSSHGDRPVSSRNL